MLLIQLRGQVNIKIMRAFTKMRQLIINNAELRKEIENLRADVDEKFQVVFETLDQLLAVDSKQKKIGFLSRLLELTAWRGTWRYYFDLSI